MPRARHRQGGPTPVLLVTFVAAVLVMVLAVAAIGVTGSDWGDAGAIVPLIALLGLLMALIRRELGDDEAPATDPRTPSAADT